MADSLQQSIVSLALVAETCTVSVAALLSSQSSSSASLPNLHNDLLSLLSLIYQSTTKLSIALNPSGPTYQASISPLQELTQHINALTSCASLFDPNQHGKALRSEVINIVSDVLLSLNALTNTFLSIARDGPCNVPKDEYLIRTGAVHNLIDKARTLSGLSQDNLQAVGKRWAEDKSTLDDAYGELSEMIQNIDEGDDDFPYDDGSDEFNLGSSKKLTPDEVERVEKVQPLLRITTLLHKRVLLDLLNQSPSALPVESPQFTSSLDDLVKISSDFLAATDEVVATLYSPQDPSLISSALTSLFDVTKTLQKTLIDNGFIPQKQALERTLASMTIADGKSTTTNAKSNPGVANAKDTSRWFDTCFTQIAKLCNSLCESFDND